MGQLQNRNGTLITVGGSLANNAGCCCGTGESCTFCHNFLAPSRLEIELSGIGDKTCGNCDDFNTNGTPYILDQRIADPCEWRHTLETEPCPLINNGTIINAGLFFQFGDYNLGVTIRIDGFTYVSWSKNFGSSRPVCTGWDSLDVPFFSDEPLWNCDGNPGGVDSICTVTALA